MDKVRINITQIDWECPHCGALNMLPGLWELHELKEKTIVCERCKHEFAIDATTKETQ